MSLVAEPAKSGSSGGSLIFILVIGVVLALVLVNSRRRARVTATKQSTISVGTTIVTRAGLIATLVEQHKEYVVLQLEDGTRARYLPQAVARVWEEPTAAEVPLVDPAPAADAEPPAEPRSLAD